MTKYVLNEQETVPQWCWVPSQQSQILPREQPIYSSTWVRLLEPPTPFCDEEALILCQHSDSEWVAWIPDYGETILHNSQFCLYR
ncbi:hypothetical protein IQ238_28810 [Pleurocapsales cyanobacterium LEGE 06147]|nr:hypothetical protein [Pleurocapsales cyanobacterium LEGE 06147]